MILETKTEAIQMLLLQFYVPDSHLELVKDAVFAAGAGKIGNYDSCAWQTKGTGQYRPLSGSQPYLGQTGRVESVVEWKVEVVLCNSSKDEVLQALQRSHPYETPAYQFITVST